MPTRAVKRHRVLRSDVAWAEVAQPWSVRPSRRVAAAEPSPVVSLARAHHEMHGKLPHIHRFLAALVLVATTATTAGAHPGSGIAVDRSGRVYFVDTGGGVWVIEPNGQLARHGEPRFHWMALDPDGQRSGRALPSIPGGEITALGSHPTLLLSSDVPIAIGRDGVLYYPELGSEGRLRIMQLPRSGARSLLAVLPVRAQGPALRWINGLAAGQDGSVYYTEDNAVRRIGRRGVVSTLAENLSVPDCAPVPGAGGGGPYLRGLAVADDGTVFVAASGCGAVLAITSQGRITPVLRATPPWSPTAVAVSSGAVYVLEYLHTAIEDRQAWVPRVRKIQPNGRIVDLAAVQRTTHH